MQLSCSQPRDVGAKIELIELSSGIETGKLRDREREGETDSCNRFKFNLH